MLNGLDDRVGQVPVVLASRTGAGAVLTDVYGFPGSERDLMTRGLIPAGFLDPYKARILLHASLAAGADRSMLMAAFRAAGGTPADASDWPWDTTTGAKRA
jgi:L-asparaginase